MQCELQIIKIIYSVVILKNLYILQDDAEEEDYNADTIITVRDFPHITMTLAEVFGNVE